MNRWRLRLERFRRNVRSFLHNQCHQKRCRHVAARVIEHHHRRCRRGVRHLARCHSYACSRRAHRRLKNCYSIHHVAHHVRQLLGGHFSVVHHVPHHGGAHHYVGHCRHRMHLIRRHVHRVQKAAAKCGVTDSHCVAKAYRRVARARAHLARAARACRHHKRDGHRHGYCYNAHRRIRRLRLRRASLMARAGRCHDESTHCVHRIMRRVLRMNRHIRRKARKCHVHLSWRARQHVNHVRLHPVYSDSWRHAITCDSMRAHFKKWIHYQNLRRNALHLEACHCNPLDTSCIRFTFTQIVHIQQRIAKARTEFAEQLNACDSCAPLKLKFRRWLRRQRRRRLRIHNALCRCRNSDLECYKRRYARIVRLQKKIAERRALVMHLHGDCSAHVLHHGHAPNNGWHHTTDAPTSYVPKASVSPGIFPSIARFGAASMTAVSLAAVAAAALAVAVVA